MFGAIITQFELENKRIPVWKLFFDINIKNNLKQKIVKMKGVDVFDVEEEEELGVKEVDYDG